jgi:hypothetical protein
MNIDEEPNKLDEVPTLLVRIQKLEMCPVQICAGILTEISHSFLCLDTVCCD